MTPTARLADVMLVDCLIEDARWENAGFEGLAETAAVAVLAHLGMAADEFLVSVLACDDAKIAALNGDFRGKSTPTNVLSWPSEERGSGTEGVAPEIPVPGLETPCELGDIAISFDTCQHEANAANKPFKQHVLHLMVHGTLHLLGYDHISDKDAALMEGIETEVLAALGVPDPYADHEVLSLGKLEQDR